MTARTVILPDGRLAREVPADEAGEHYLSVADGIIAQMAGTVPPLLTWRQAEALNTLARLRRASGLRHAWERPAGAGERQEEVEAAARDELAGLLAIIAEPTRGHILGMLSSGEWQFGARVSRIQDAADAVADRLRLARETP